jgi:hypothetical protein
VKVDGTFVQEPIRIDDATVPERFARLTDNQKYWTDRWAGDTNYRYWKDRASAEMEKPGVQARQYFYEGTKALRTADFPLAVARFQAGLDLWKDLLDRHPVYRNDELNKKDTGRIVKRHVQALRLAGQEPPKDLPSPTC